MPPPWGAPLSEDEDELPPVEDELEELVDGPPEE